MGGRVLLNTQRIFEHAGVEPGMHVADFGCGQTGHFVLPAARLVGETGRVYAVDLVPEILASLENRLALAGILNVETVWGDFEQPGRVAVAEHSLDRVFLVNTLWVVSNVASTLGEARRLLKPEGRVVIVDWHKKTNHPVAPPVHARTERVATMRALAQSGACSLHEFSLGNTHWGLMAPFA